MNELTSCMPRPPAASAPPLASQGRLQMELTSLLGYGACEPSLLLMWRLGLLDMLLPQHALYLRVRTAAQLHSCLLRAAPGLVLQAPAMAGCSPCGRLLAHRSAVHPIQLCLPAPTFHSQLPLSALPPPPSSTAAQGASRAAQPLPQPPARASV